jgi:hypothetical protein
MTKVVARLSPGAHQTQSRRRLTAKLVVAEQTLQHAATHHHHHCGGLHHSTSCRVAPRQKHIQHRRDSERVLTPQAAAPASSSPARTCQRRSPATTQAVVAAPGPPPQLPLALWNTSAKEKEQSAPDLLQPAVHLQPGASCCTQPARHHGGQSDPPLQLLSAKPTSPPCAQIRPNASPSRRQNGSLQTAAPQPAIRLATPAKRRQPPSHDPAAPEIRIHIASSRCSRGHTPSCEKVSSATAGRRPPTGFARRREPTAARGRKGGYTVCG